MKIDSKRSALLIMDYQNGILSRVEKGKDNLLNKAKDLLDTARKHDLKVIYVVIGFRKGYPEVGSNNKIFHAAKQVSAFEHGSESVKIHESVKPQENDLIATKHRISAFAGSDLEMILRANDINTLILAGISTSGVVLSTLRQAADLDYQLAVIKDCCTDPDEEVHQCLMDKVFPRQADVMTTADLKASLAD